ncbi:phage portal protein [bacterium]|nr:phage portal protein [bacterium]
MSDLVKAQVVGTDGRGVSKQLPDSPWHEAYARGEVVEPPYDLEALAALYETNSTHKACVDAKTINIVGLGYRFVPVGGEREADSGNLALLQHLFDNSNPEMTFTEVLRAVWTDVECLGNGYLELTRNSRGQIDGMYHVPGTTVRVLADRSGFVQVRDGRKRVFRNVGGEPVAVGDRSHNSTQDGGDGGRGATASLADHSGRGTSAALADHSGRGTSPRPTGDAGEQNEVLHFMKYTPQSSYYGVPDIIPAVSAVAGDKAAREYNIDFFSHNAVPRMAIIVEGGELSEGVVTQLKHFMESEIKGHGHKTLVLEVPGGGANVRLEKLTVGGCEDAAFLEYRRANRDEVLLVHRVPPSKVTVVENANLANSNDQDKTFREQVVRPEQRRIEYRLNRLVREQLGIGDWAFQFREMDLSEAREEAEVAAIYAGIGVLSAEEIRGRLGMVASPVAQAVSAGR